VDTLETLDSIQLELEGSQTLYLDSEWNPIGLKSAVNEIQILQIYTGLQFIVMDHMQLKKHME